MYVYGSVPPFFSSFPLFLLLPSFLEHSQNITEELPKITQPANNVTVTYLLHRNIQPWIKYIPQLHLSFKSESLLLAYYLK